MTTLQLIGRQAIPMKKTDHPLSGTQIILAALGFAAHKRRRQSKNDATAATDITQPIQIAHVLGVEGNIADEQVIAAAILHDTIEDTETTNEELRQQFGLTIAEVVEEVTKDTSMSAQELKRHQLEQAPRISRRAKLIQLAEKICDLRDMADNPPPDLTTRQIQDYFDWSKEVVDCMRGISPSLEAAFDEVYARRPA
jgi:guanosine-3',5'-bis(diphosphate) 3'-pyrophosphohydrolase